MPKLDERADGQTDQNLRDREAEVKDGLAEHLQREQDRGDVQAGVAQAGQEDGVFAAADGDRSSLRRHGRVTGIQLHPLLHLVAMRVQAKLMLGMVLLGALTAACDPFGLPATRALENGVDSMLTSAKSFEIAGDYTAQSTHWTIDLQLTRPASRHITVKSSTDQVEAIILGGDAYFRGQAFLAKHFGADPLSQNIAKAAGNAWWKDTAGLVPSLPNLTDGSFFRTNFLGSAVTRRTDHQSVAGADAVELSGVRADVFIESPPPTACCVCT